MVGTSDTVETYQMVHGEFKKLVNDLLEAHCTDAGTTRDQLIGSLKAADQAKELSGKDRVIFILYYFRMGPILDYFRMGPYFKEENTIENPKDFEHLGTFLNFVFCNLWRRQPFSYIALNFPYIYF